MSKPESPQLSPFEFGAELVSTIRTALNDGADSVEEANRTPATIRRWPSECCGRRRRA